VPRLIVNADDFGLTAGVNRAILELHAAGLLTSATLMARAGASQEAIEIARAAPALGVGCHIVLVDGEPILPAGQIPSLTEQSSGHFFPSLSALLPRLFSGRVRPDQIEREARAQIEFLLDQGVRLTHIDTHKHTHMFPSVLRPVLRAARACGIRAIRNPFEPPWAVQATPRAAWLRTLQMGLLRMLQPSCRRMIAEEGFATTGGTLAVVGTGVLDATALRSVLRHIPEGTWELVTHPGYNDADLGRVRTRLRKSRDIEREALSALKEFPAVELISFADL
jgi:hopanoid biosynthesis associated protein HpnK